jgi:argininosuccinate lyase
VAKLWQKGYTINNLLESFTVGQDYLLDSQLIKADCAGSVAHTRGLAKVGLLDPQEQRNIEQVIQTIAQQADQAPIEISISQEDCHTWIEEHLTHMLGDLGKKVHLGRSRNDQVLTTLRLYGKDMILRIRRSLLELIIRLADFAEIHERVPMPGRTHMQIAMPSTLGLWAVAYLEQLLQDYSLIMAVWHITDCSPLGAAASYGVPLPLDREFTQQTLGFAKLFRNPLGANNSRGKIESATLDSLDQIAITLSKLAQDLILFSLPEFGYFSLPDELTSGSSIMPQKKNPDGLELMRARAASISGWATQAKNVIRSLPSGYNRDFQDTKEPFLRGLRTALECITISDLTIEKLVVHPDKLTAGFTSDIYATDDAIALVEQGYTFRDAYKQVGMNLDQVKTRNPEDLLARRTSVGYAGNLGLKLFRNDVDGLIKELTVHEEVHSSAMADCLGGPLRLS